MTTKRYTRQTHFDFIGKRKLALFISTLLNLGILLTLALVGFRYGVDFAGGTVVEVKFNHSVTPEEVRQRVEKAGLRDVVVQRIGGRDDNTFMVQLGGTTQLTEEAAAAARGTVEQLAKAQGTPLVG
ncbi:MAG: hypothetical protein L0Y66_19715 [Myxococcaceae bacterium]|nr:hypothetical protein [Myxococcaceae bacterium]MCI0672037.1 hypothetical protein [Myxococcaceae bacterium]